jgi:hypothetical protein
VSVTPLADAFAAVVKAVACAVAAPVSCSIAMTWMMSLWRARSAR